MKKKYEPSVDNNYQEKTMAIKALNKLALKMERGRCNNGLDYDTVCAQNQKIKDMVAKLENSAGDGTEYVGHISQKTRDCIDSVDKAIMSDMNGHLEETVDSLDYVIQCWVDINDGLLNGEDDEFVKNENFGERIINKKLQELGEIKDKFYNQVNKINTQITSANRDVEECKSKIKVETRPHIIKNIYRNIKTKEAEIDKLTKRYNQFSSCYSLINQIYTYVEPRVEAGLNSSGELGNMLGLLKMNDLRNVIDMPEKALPILRAMDQQIQEIDKTTTKIDKEVFGMSDMDEILKYRDSLIEEENIQKDVSSEIEKMDSKKADRQTQKI